MAQILTVSPAQPEAHAVHTAAQLIRRGDVVGIPTDTVYGLAADPFNLAAVARIYEIKGRVERRALPILVGSVEQAQGLMGSEIPDVFFTLADRFWPGPLTLVVDAGARVPFKLTGHTGRIALRRPASKITDALITAVGNPITGTSANVSGFPACASADQVAKQLGGRLSLILDGGESQAVLASTVVDVRQDSWAILREGPVSEEEIRQAVGD